MALVYDLVSDKNLSLCCATETSELVYVVVENYFSEKLMRHVHVIFTK